VSDQFWLITGGIAQTIAAIFTIWVVIQSAMFRRESNAPIWDITRELTKDEQNTKYKIYKQIMENNHNPIAEISADTTTFELQIKNIGEGPARKITIHYYKLSGIDPVEILITGVKKTEKYFFVNMLNNQAPQIVDVQENKYLEPSIPMIFASHQMFKGYLQVECLSKNGEKLITKILITNENGCLSKIISRKWEKQFLII